MALFRNQRADAVAKTDIVMSILPEHVDNIARGLKNHEYRKFLLPPSVRRIWFYTSYPVGSMQFVAQVGRGRKPGEVPEDDGLGNADFNAGKTVSKFGYEIQKLWKVSPPVSLAMAKEHGYLKAPPQRYNYTSETLLLDLRLGDMEKVLDRASQVGKKRRSGPQGDADELPKKARTEEKGSVSDDQTDER